MLFIGDAEAGQRSAIIYTVIEACRRRRIDPFEYLRDIFTRMPTMDASSYPGLTPEAWLKARQSEVKYPANLAEPAPETLAA